ncbi:MAG: hypothetical protein KY469_18840 [Actinobacteria bacterium]|nr:hypothetical protein [Actinomycetota bacterium]
MGAISERREVRVQEDGKDFVFVADPDRGRLTLRQETPDGDEDVCRITVEDADELTAFLEGLARVLGARAQAGAAAPVPSTPSSAGQGRRPRLRAVDDTGDRDEVVERARERNANAFRSWTRDEERQLVTAFEDGASLADLAREHGRSQRAIEMRLQKLGALPSS